MRTWSRVPSSASPVARRDQVADRDRSLACSRSEPAVGQCDQEVEHYANHQRGGEAYRRVDERRAGCAMDDERIGNEPNASQQSAEKHDRRQPVSAASQPEQHARTGPQDGDHEAADFGRSGRCVARDQPKSNECQHDRNRACHQAISGRQCGVERRRPPRWEATFRKHRHHPDSPSSSRQWSRARAWSFRRARRRKERFRAGPCIDHTSVFHVHDPMCGSGDGLVVGDHQDRLAAGMSAREQLEDLLAAFGVQRTGRFVGEQHGWSIGEGSSDGEALSLTARQHARQLP